MCIRTLISETRQKNVEIEGPEYESHSFFSVVSHFRQKIERSTGNLVQELNEVLYCKLLFVVTICEKIKNGLLFSAALLFQCFRGYSIGRLHVKRKIEINKTFRSS